MRKYFFQVAPAAKTTDFALLLLRVGFSAFMIIGHGYPKLQKLLAGGDIKFASVMGMSPAVSLTLAVVAEFGCSLLLILGLFTRLATIPLIATMLVALLVVHAGDPFGDQEMALHYLVVYLVLLLSGPGRYSIDALLHRRR